VDELGWRAGRGQGCGDFACDVTGLAHPGHGDAPGRHGQQVQGAAEFPVQRSRQRVEPFRLQAQHLTAGIQVHGFAGGLTRTLRVFLAGLWLRAHLSLPLGRL
jgi:hypothetical protein